MGGRPAPSSVARSASDAGCARRTQRGRQPYSGNNIGLYWYAQDNFRVNRSLTLNLGVRYEFNGVAQSMNEFDQNALASFPGLITFKAPASQKKNFAPRIGFAYSPGTSSHAR